MNSTVTMFILELGMVEPRPCHERFPMKPRSWQLTDVTAWGAEFRFDLVGVDRRNGASAPADGSRRGRHHRHCPTRGRLTAGKWLGKDEHGLATAILTTRNSVTISMSQNAENVRTVFENTTVFRDFQAEYSRATATRAFPRFRLRSLSYGGRVANTQQLCNGMGCFTPHPRPGERTPNEHLQTGAGNTYFIE